jgi:hypothetical protein
MVVKNWLRRQPSLLALRVHRQLHRLCVTVPVPYKTHSAALRGPGVPTNANLAASKFSSALVKSGQSAPATPTSAIDQQADHGGV